jgi:hypothetical protein
MKTHTRHIIDFDDLELEIPFDDPYGMDIEDEMLIDRMPDGKIVVSYIVTDDHAGGENPAEEECWGWDPWIILESQRDADELSQLLNTCTRCGYEFDDHDPEQYEPGEAHEFVNSHREAMKAGRAFYFEKYEHGLVNYALRGEASQVDRQWDVTAIAGFMEAADDVTPSADYSIEDMARASLETYTAWCNGWVYGVVHCTYEADGTFIDEESCWGFIGDEWAISQLKDEHAGYLT